MDNEGKYYFAFRKKHELYGYWVEIFTYSEKEAIDAFHTLYETWSHPINKNALKYHTKGCYRQIHFPLPENVEFNSDPFFNDTKRHNFIWAAIGSRMSGKSNFTFAMIKEWEKQRGKHVIIFDPKK